MADGEQGFLGLTHNPFTTESNDFFEGGDRRTHLEQLRHLTQWPRRVMLVTGPLGVGKTTLYRQLSMTLEPRVKAARINGVLVNTAREVLASVAQGIAATTGPETGVQAMAQALATYIIGQERQGRFCLVMVDDAHLLDFQSLEELLKLTKNSPAYVCLFGEPNLVHTFSKPAARNDLAWHEIRLAGFALPDIEKYLAWKLSLAQYRGRIPFSSGQLTRLTKVTGGLPAAINHVGAELIERLESGTAASGGVRFPVAHSFLVVLLVVVVSLAYLVLNSSEDRVPDADQTSVSTLTLPGAKPAADAAAGSTDKPDVPLSKGLEPATDGRADRPDSSGTARTSGQTVSVSLPRPVNPGAKPPELAPGPDTTSEPPAVVPPPAPLPTLSSPPPSVSVVEKTAERAPPVILPKPSPVSTGTAASAPVGGARDAAWLKQQAGSRFTIQLVSVSSQERLQAYLRQQRNPSQFAWYPIERGGKTLFVVTFGQYESKAAAEAAVKMLPVETGQVQPWVRPMTLVQEAIAAGR